MNTILIYDKETGNIDGCVNAQSIDYFLNGTLSPVYVQAKTFDDQGNEVGEVDVHLYDPDHGFLWNKEVFPTLQKGLATKDICYATQNRQDAVRDLCKIVDILLVIGAQNSSNSNRLKEIADNKGKPSYLIDGPEDIDNEWLDGISSIGITAGASAPEILVQEVVSFLMSNGGSEVIELGGAEESVSFPIPALLKE